MSKLQHSLEQKLDNWLTCAVCLYHYTDPRILPCHHSFCLKCVERFREVQDQYGNYLLSCPICRSEHQLPKGGAKDFPNSYYFRNLLDLELELINDKISQTSCFQHHRPLQFYCISCSICICKSCTLGHVEHIFKLIEMCYFEYYQRIISDLTLNITAHSKKPASQQDKGIQCSYLTPFCVVLEGECVGKHLYTVSGMVEEVLSWDEMGIKLIAPKGLVPDSSNSCDVAVLSMLSGKFIFPDNSFPVSGIFAIDISCKIKKPITIELHHCVDLSKEDKECMFFAKAEHSGDQRPPYIFERCVGGVFVPGSQYASLDSQSFSLIAIFRSIRCWVTGRPDPSIKYRAQIFYLRQSSSGHSIVYFVVIKNVKNLVRGVMNDMKQLQCEEGPEVLFSFDDTKVSLECLPDLESDKWEILPQQRPCEFQKDVVDAYGSSSSALHKLMFHVNPKEGCSRRLYLEIRIKGAAESELSLYFTCNPPNPVHRISKPTVQEVLTLLLTKSCKWNEIGLALNVPLNFRDGLEGSSDVKLERVISKWIESECSEVSWRHFQDVLLNKLKFVDIARNSEEFFSSCSSS